MDPSLIFEGIMDLPISAEGPIWLKVSLRGHRLFDCAGYSCVLHERDHFSLGCDLGTHIEEEMLPASRKVSGGYIQLAAMNCADASTSQYDNFCDAFGDELEPYAGKRRWAITLEGTYVQFKLPGELAVKAPSLWIWFFAKARTHEKLNQSREELLTAIAAVLHSDKVRGCLPG